MTFFSSLSLSLVTLVTLEAEIETHIYSEGENGIIRDTVGRIVLGERLKGDTSRVLYIEKPSLSFHLPICRVPRAAAGGKRVGRSTWGVTYKRGADSLARGSRAKLSSRAWKASLHAGEYISVCLVEPAARVSRERSDW